MDTAIFVIEMLLIGGVVGVMSAALGIGGGILMVPAFLLVIPGMDPHTAKGTSLFIIIFVALVNVWRLHATLDHIPWRLAAWLGAGAVLGGYAGAWLTSIAPERVVLGVFIALIVALGGFTYWFHPPAIKPDEVRARPGRTLLIGLIAGVAGGGTGTGGGSVLIPLALLAGIVHNARVVGLSNMVMVVTAVFGTIAHLRAEPYFDSAWTVGHVALGLAPLVFIGAQFGAPLGAWINARMSLARRRQIMSILLVLIALQLTLRMLG